MCICGTEGLMNPLLDGAGGVRFTNTHWKCTFSGTVGLEIRWKSTTVDSCYSHFGNNWLKH